MLGATRSVENPYGKKVKVTVPEGAQPGDKLRLRGLGVQKKQGTGDLYVVVNVRVPQGLSEREKDLLRETGRKGGWV